MDKKKKEKTETSEESFEVGCFRPEDADGMVRLFHAVYGAHYPIKLFYDPEAIVTANREGRYYSIVARAASGEVVGATHLYPSAPFRSLYEHGVGLVLKEYRNTGLNKRLLDFLYTEFVPRNPHIEEVFGEPVCNHLHMQRAAETFKFVETAIEAALMPAETYDKEKSATGRVATLCAFRCYRPKPHRIFLPAPYEQELRMIYSRLDDTRDIVLSDTQAPDDLKSRAEVTVFGFAQVARIAVHEIGADFREHFAEIEKRAIAQKAVVLQAWLNLSTPWVGAGVEELRKMGYFFGGALPRWFDGDGLLMQKLLCPPCFESIQLHSEFSKELMEIIKKDWQRAGCS
jgi:hypothetical protein